MKRIVVLAVLALAVCGCTNWEKTTYQALATALDALNNAQTAYEVSAATGNCAAAIAQTPAVQCIPHTTAAYKSITDGKVIWKTAADGMVTYETLKAKNAGPDALSKAQNEVAAALGQVGTIVADVKALYAIGGKK
jgi:hypothetical protein